jgi:hypothetical protein
MTRDADDVVKVFSGTLIEVEGFQLALADAGIESKIVGTELTASFGSAIPGSIELWVHRADADKARAAITRDEERKANKQPGQKHPHPTSDPKPPAPPARKEPHVKQDPFGQ